MKKRFFLSFLLLAALVCLLTIPAAADYYNGYDYTVNSAGNVCIEEYTGTAASVSVPAALQGHPVTEIAFGAFSSHSEITTLLLPDSLTYMDDYAFSGCSGITSVTVPGSVGALGFGVFEDCSALSDVVLKSGVTSIGDACFSGCTRLKSITIPASVTTIAGDIFGTGVKPVVYGETGSTAADYAAAKGLTFSQMSDGDGVYGDLEYFVRNDGRITISGYVGDGGPVTVPGNIGGRIVDIIGYAAFQETAVTDVTLPESITTIDDQAFLLSDLTSINLPSSITYIGETAFYGTDLTGELVLPEGLTEIQSSTFQACNFLKGVKIPSSVTVIKSGAFASSGLTSVVIPSGVTQIGPNAFFNCDDLLGMTLPDTVTTIGSNAFEHCTSMTSIFLPESVTSIGADAFKDCTKLTILGSADSAAASYAAANSIPFEVLSDALKYHISLQGTIVIDGYKGTASNLTIPEVIEGRTVTEIARRAFYQNYTLVSVNLPKTLVSTGDNAFEDCSSLTSVTIPNGIPEIGNESFAGCNKLTNVTIPASVTTLGTAAFRGCSSITSITIPGSIETVSVNAFTNCFKLTDVVISEGVTTLGNSAFSGCRSLINISFPSTMDTWGEQVFSGCNAFENFTIPATVTNFGGWMFKYCTGLKTVTIPEGYTEIPEATFIGCTSLTSVSIPASVTKIGDRVFEDCTGLTNFVVPDTVTVLGDFAFDNCESLASVTLSKNLTEVNRYVFYGCSSLTSIVIPDKVTAIHDDAFHKCTSLNHVVLPADLKTIYAEAFYGCTSLTAVALPDGLERINYNAFGGCTGLTVLTIPGSVMSFGRLAFENCTSLRSVVFAEGCKRTGTEMFKGCTALEDVTFPSTMEEIESGSFMSCRKLKEAVLPFGFFSIQAEAFAYCESLEKVVIPITATARYLSDTAFAGCTKLTIYGEKDSAAETYAKNNNIAFVSDSRLGLGHGNVSGRLSSATGRPLSVTVELLQGDTVLRTELSGTGGTFSIKNVPNGTYTLRAKASSDSRISYSAQAEIVIADEDVVQDLVLRMASVSGKCGDNLTWRVDGDANLTISGTGPMYDYEMVHDEVWDRTIPAAPWHIYSQNILKLNIESGVTSIGKNAFRKCSNIAGSLTIPNTVTSIGSYAFYECTGFNGTLTLPAGLTSIGESAFAACNGFTGTLTIPGGVKNIPDTAFGGCSKLTGLNLSDGLKTIGKNAFAWNAGLTGTLTIPGTVTTIGETAFYDNDQLDTVTIPASVTTISKGAFSYCEGVKNISIAGHPTIGNSAFYGMTATVTYDAAKGWTDAEKAGYGGTLTWVSAKPLTITTQPASQTVTLDSSASFKVVATGAASYQWQWRAGSAGTWKDCSSATVGYNTANLKPVATNARNGYQYRCVVKDAFGNSVTSSAATLTVTTGPAITTQPVSQTVALNGTASFKVVATGASSYQWQWKAATTDWANCSSATSGYNTANLKPVGTAARNGYQYRCIVKDASGASVTSNTVTLTVKAGLAITTQPVSQTVALNESASFKVVATGASSYQWQWKAATTDWANCSSATSGYNAATLKPVGTSARNGYQYRCIVKDADGKSVTSNAATLTVKAATTLAITTQPASTTVTEGSTASFKVVATGASSYQWQWRASSTGTWANCSSATTGYNTATLKPVGTAARNGYQYRCIVKDASGKSVTSNAATLTVKAGLAITSQPVSVSVTEGSTATFKVVATGASSYQWQWRESSTSTWKDCSSATSGYNTTTLKPVGTAARNGYQYRCVVKDASGNSVTSNTATLTVKAATTLAITTQPASQTVALNGTASFKVVATGASSYQWQWRAGASDTWANCSSATAGYNTANLKPVGTAARNGYQYRCIVKDASGNSVTSNTATLTVK